MEHGLIRRLFRRNIEDHYYSSLNIFSLLLLYEIGLKLEKKMMEEKLFLCFK